MRSQRFHVFLLINALLATAGLKIDHHEWPKAKLAERGFDPRTSGLWAQHASTAPLCCSESIRCKMRSRRFHVFMSINVLLATEGLKICHHDWPKAKIAERGFDPRTSGLWAQHASTAPLCCSESLRCKMRSRRFHVFMSINVLLATEGLKICHHDWPKAKLAERGFDPRTSGLWAQHASTAPLCCSESLWCKMSSRRFHVFLSINALLATAGLKIGHHDWPKAKLAERGFDPRTSGLWAQHASTAPLCCSESLRCKMRSRRFHVFMSINALLATAGLKIGHHDWPKAKLAERGFDPRNSGLWAQHASTAPLCCSDSLRCKMRSRRFNVSTFFYRLTHYWQQQASKSAIMNDRRPS